jgi:hypothetical protein
MRIEGNFDQLAGKIQERYGIECSEAERQIEAWMASTCVTQPIKCEEAACGRPLHL